MGKIYEQLEYTPYGELWVEHVPVVETMPFRFTGKERDSETGLYYYGARYLNPQTGMWLSADPAMGEYIPQAPINDEAKKHNQNLPGMGEVFNYVNLHAYHYAGNNPVVLKDPDGRIDLTLNIKTPVYTIRPMTQQEAAFIYEILGVSVSTKIYIQEAGFVGNSAVSLPNGYNSGILTFSNQNTLIDSASKGQLVHEWFHQYQYNQNFVEAGIGLGFEAFCNKILGPVFDGKQDAGYRFGDYRQANALLNVYQTLDDLPNLESMAQLVGQFAELYDMLKTKGSSKLDRKCYEIIWTILKVGGDSIIPFAVKIGLNNI